MRQETIKDFCFTLSTILLSDVGVRPTHRANLQGSPSTCSVTPNSDVWLKNNKKKKTYNDFQFQCESKCFYLSRSTGSRFHKVQYWDPKFLQKKKITNLINRPLTRSLLLYMYLLLPFESLTSLLKTSDISKRKRWRSRPLRISVFGSQTWKDS